VKVAQALRLRKETTLTILENRRALAARRLDELEQQALPAIGLECEVRSMQRAWQDRGEFTSRVAVAQAVKRFGQALDDHGAERRSLISKLKGQISLI